MPKCAGVSSFSMGAGDRTQALMLVQQASSWAFSLARPSLFLWLKWNDDEGDIHQVFESRVPAKLCPGTSHLKFLWLLDIYSVDSISVAIS